MILQGLSDNISIKVREIIPAALIVNDKDVWTCESCVKIRKMKLVYFYQAKKFDEPQNSVFYILK